MTGRAFAIVAAAVAMLSLAGCGEKVQTTDAAVKKSDAEPWTVSDSANPAYLAPGWKPGDKAAWEAQIRQRNQSQNEYAR